MSSDLNMRFELLKNNETSQYDCAFLFSVPLKITSSIDEPRIDFALCSPITKRIESATLLFPHPFGPTIAVMPGSNLTSTLSANDLKPYMSSFSKFISFILYFF